MIGCDDYSKLSLDRLIKTTSSEAVNPFAQFDSLIEDVAEIFNEATDLYKMAQHNKDITEKLMQRIDAANSAVSVLRDDLSSKDFIQKLVIYDAVNY